MAKNVQELRQIASAGGSLIVDLDKTNLNVADLRLIAQNLAKGATLIIKAGSADRLSVGMCLQIVKENPGKVTFWF